MANLAGYVQGAMATSGAPSMFGDDVTADQIIEAIAGNTTENDSNAQTQTIDAGGQPAGSGDSGRRADEVGAGDGKPDAALGGAGPGQGGERQPTKDHAEVGQPAGQGDQGQREDRPAAGAQP